MSLFEIMVHGMRALEHRKEERMARGYKLDFTCDVELYFGLLLEGQVEVTVTPGEEGLNELDDFKVTLQDKNGKECEVDWDDLKDGAQSRIKHQIHQYLDEMKLCA